MRISGLSIWNQVNLVPQGVRYGCAIKAILIIS
jgi:hypothetical protein